MTKISKIADRRIRIATYTACVLLDSVATDKIRIDSSFVDQNGEQSASSPDNWQSRLTIKEPGGTETHFRKILSASEHKSGFKAIAWLETNKDGNNKDHLIISYPGFEKGSASDVKSALITGAGEQNPQASCVKPFLIKLVHQLEKIGITNVNKVDILSHSLGTQSGVDTLKRILSYTNDKTNLTINSRNSIHLKIDPFAADKAVIDQSSKMAEKTSDSQVDSAKRLWKHTIEIRPEIPSFVHYFPDGIHRVNEISKPFARKVYHIDTGHNVSTNSPYSQKSISESWERHKLSTLASALMKPETKITETMGNQLSAQQLIEQPLLPFTTRLYDAAETAALTFFPTVSFRYGEASQVTDNLLSEIKEEFGLEISKLDTIRLKISTSTNAVESIFANINDKYLPEDKFTKLLRSIAIKTSVQEGMANPNKTALDHIVRKGTSYQEKSHTQTLEERRKEKEKTPPSL